jgi:hypothetical protein
LGLYSKTSLEEWRDIEGYEGLYQVSNLGRVKSKRCILKPIEHYSGYQKYHLYKDRKMYNKTAHRLVASAFLTPKNHKKDVNHRDGNKKNNFYLNLEYVTKAENSEHAYLIGLHSQQGERNGRSKLSALDVSMIYSFKGCDVAIKKSLCNRFSIKMATINDIFAQRRWKHLTDRLEPVKYSSKRTSKGGHG